MVSFVRLIVLSRKSNLPKNVSKQINILGNAPSIKNCDIDFSYPTMVTNGFAIDPEFYIKTKPFYYIFCDDKFFDPTCYHTEIMINAMNKRDWDMNILTPKPKKHDRVINTNYRYNKTTIEGFEKFVLWCTKHNFGMPSPANVLIPCLILAINMGYKKIHLYGFEFSWYKESIFGEKQSALHNYVEPQDYDLPDLETSLFTFHRTVYGLNIIKKYAELNNVEIINHCNFRII
jgi:hypothetical protein